MRKDTDREGNFLVHCSSVPEFPNCNLKWAVDNITDLTQQALQEKNYDGDSNSSPLIGAIFGTSGHLGVQLMQEEKKATNQIDLAKATRQAQEKLEELCVAAKNELTWDSTTTKLKIAKEQLANVLHEVALRYMPRAVPGLIEVPLEAQWAPGFKLVGRPDAVIEVGENGAMVDDFKFGAKLGHYGRQIGSYKILVASNFDVDVLGGRIVHVKRTGITKAQTKLHLVKYDFETVVKSTEKTMNRIVEVVTEYKKDKDLSVFDTNPNNKFCTQKTCKAWGTSMCGEWIMESSKDAEDDALLWVS